MRCRICVELRGICCCRRSVATMRTWLTYENYSLNPHVCRIGLFWNIACMVPGTVPVLWEVIEKCRYGWHHPLNIEWEERWMLRDRWGNQQAINPGSSQSVTGTFVEGPFGHGLNSTITLTQKIPQPNLQFIICRNDKPIAEIPLDLEGSWHLQMPDRLKMQLDCRTKLNERIYDRRGTEISLKGIRSLKVALRGGTPGPMSTPLEFSAYSQVAS